MYSSRITVAFFCLLSAALFVLANPLPVTNDLKFRQLDLTGITGGLGTGSGSGSGTTGGDDGKAAIGALSNLLSQIQSLLSQGTDNGGVTKDVSAIVAQLQPTVNNVISTLQGISSETLSSEALPQVNSLVQQVVSNISNLLKSSGGSGQDGLNNILNNILGAVQPLLGNSARL